MKTIFAVISIMLITFVNAQDMPTVRFDTLNLDFKKVDENKLRIIKTRSKENQVIAIPVIQNDFNALEKDSTLNYVYIVKVNKGQTNLLSSEYKLTSSEIIITKSKKEIEIFLEIKKDPKADRERIITLEIELKKGDDKIDVSNRKTYYKLEILIIPIESPLDGYEYLAYVGTNFDLVEGIKAKDLFFAANIYKAPKRRKRSVGFYLSIYGNRAITQIDSTSPQRTTITVNPLTDSTYSRVNTTKYFVTKEVTDNLGAYISPLIKLKFLNPKNEKRDLNLYYSPSMEFVYRRTNINIRDSNRFSVDSTLVEGNINDAVLPPTNNSPLFGQSVNEFSFNFGIIGLFMSLENKKMSVRVHTSVGYASNYYRDIVGGRKLTGLQQKGDVFFSGRAWITESTTGITLQAEVTNLLDEPRPFFVATLSKAFNFRDIGKIFQPIATR